MLIEFKVKNLFCFKDEAILSLEKGKGSELMKNISKESNLLRSAVIFGPNASGKTKLFQIIGRFILFTKYSGSEEIPINRLFEHFKLEKGCEEKPLEMKCIFIIDNIKHSYEYKILKNEIIFENLSYYPNNKITKLFTRKENKEVEINERIFDKVAKFAKETKSFRTNSLFLSAVANADGEISKKIIKYLSNNINVIDGINFPNAQDITARKMFNNKELEIRINNLINYLDIGIKEIKISKEKGEEPDFIKEEFKDKFQFEKVFYTKKSIHKIYNSKKQEDGDIIFDFEREESEGTKQLLALAYPIINTLDEGKTLFIDEFNTKLHPSISLFLVNLFNSEHNKKNAQLIVNTHDTNLLNLNHLRRDQIYFTEKNKYGESELYSLDNIKGVRAEDPKAEEKYLSGMFGGIPDISECNLIKIIHND